MCINKLRAGLLFAGAAALLCFLPPDFAPEWRSRALLGGLAAPLSGVLSLLSSLPSVCPMSVGRSLWSCAVGVLLSSVLWSVRRSALSCRIVVIRNSLLWFSL